MFVSNWHWRTDVSIRHYHWGISYLNRAESMLVSNWHCRTDVTLTGGISYLNGAYSLFCCLPFSL